MRTRSEGSAVEAQERIRLHIHKETRACICNRCGADGSAGQGHGHQRAAADDGQRNASTARPSRRSSSWHGWTSAWSAPLCLSVCTSVFMLISRARARARARARSVASSPRGRQLTKAGWGACEMSRHGWSAWHGWSSAGDGAWHAAAGCVSVRVHLVSRAHGFLSDGDMWASVWLGPWHLLAILMHRQATHTRGLCVRVLACLHSYVSMSGIANRLATGFPPGPPPGMGRGQ